MEQTLRVVLLLSGLPFCPTGYHVAAATVGARVGRLERSREFLGRAAEGHAAVGQLLNERGARETLERLHTASISV